MVVSMVASVVETIVELVISVDVISVVASISGSKLRFIESAVCVEVIAEVKIITSPSVSVSLVVITNRVVSCSVVVS